MRLPTWTVSMLWTVSMAWPVSMGMARPTWAENPTAMQPQERTLAICIDASVELSVNGPAKMMAAQMFEHIGLHVEWRDMWDCPTGAPMISYSTTTPSRVFPGALAYARPYEGIHVVVFTDRVRATVRSPMVSRLMAYVLVHELTHIIQGMSQHSTTGIMKAYWDAKDYEAMSRNKLFFAPEDITLIYRGLDDRAAHLVAMAAQQ